MDSEAIQRITTFPYNNQECVLYGSVLEQFVPDLERRLVGLCDPGSTEFQEHEMSFSLKTGNEPDVCLRLRRRFHVDNASPHHNVWQYRYIGSPEPDAKCPVIVRKVIDSITFSNNMMEFVKTIGLRMDYEFIAKGTCYSFSNMKILLYNVSKTEKAGNYDNLKRLTDSWIVEVNQCIPDGTEYAPTAKRIREFCDQLAPLVEMQKAEFRFQMAEEPIRELLVEGGAPQKRKLRLAIAGCSHGEMDVIYETLAEIEREKEYKFDLLICCGDYQSVRNYGDLEQMHVKDKFKQLRTFYKYYNGERIAPILTLFIGGNHEASGFLCELPNGGWVAPRIYYMGFANVIRFAGLRIGGLSGIFKPFDIHKGHYERPPFTENSIVTAYHVRNLDVWRLRQLRPKDDNSSENCLDIMLTHDWPNTIESYGNVDKLLREKPFFREDIEKGRLGNPLAMNLLWETRPRYWFAAHMHCMFAALVPHKPNESGETPEPTRFLALNKPIPHRHFLQALELEIAEDANTTDFFYDPEWLAVLRSTDSFTNTSDQKTFLPSNGSDERWDFRPTADELAAVLELGELNIPTDFKKTAHPSTGDYVASAEPTPYYRNPQSTKFCSWLGIQDLNKMLADSDPNSLGTPFYLIETMQAADPGEIKLDEDEDFGEDGFVVDTIPTGLSLQQTDDLDHFQAPAWKGEVQPVDTGEIPALKRRKVDFNEDE